MIPLWETGCEPRGPGRAILLRELRARMAATEALAGAFFRPWTGLLAASGRLYLTGELRPGRDRRWMGLLSMEERFSLARALLRAAAEFERRGLRPGPVRPENLAITTDDAILCDPLIDELLLPHRPEWEVFHRLNFTAPEILAGAAPSKDGDRFALGTTLYWLFTGVLPFDHADPRRISGRILGEHPVEPRYYLPILPDNATGAILGLLEPDPAGRPAPDGLAAFFTPAPADPARQRPWCQRRSAPPARKRRFTPAFRRSRLIPAACAAAIALNAAGILLWRTGFHPPPSPPTLREAERVVGAFYQARNSGDAWAMAFFLDSGARLPPPPDGASALWYRTGPIEVRAIDGLDRAALATVPVEEAAFVRGRIKRWSGREVFELAAEKGRWTIAGLRRVPGSRTNQEAGKPSGQKP